MSKQFWKTEPRFIIEWRNIFNGRRVQKKLYTKKKAIQLALDVRHGTLLDKAITDKVSIIDTETGEETII